MPQNARIPGMGWQASRGGVDEVRQEAEELARAKVKVKIAWSGIVGNPIRPAGAPLLGR